MEAPIMSKFRRVIGDPASPCDNISSFFHLVFWVKLNLILVRTEFSISPDVFLDPSLPTLFNHGNSEDKY